MAHHALLNTAIRAARAGGDFLARQLDRVDLVTVESKGLNDFVSEIDRGSEARIISALQKPYPNIGILAEESGQQGSAEERWVIDPLDGTTNYLHGIPHFAVSIAYMRGRTVEHGVIFDPIKNELFTASRGEGAQLNGRRIRVSKRTSLAGAIIGTGMPFSRIHHVEPYLEALRNVMPATAGVRRVGAAALDLAYVAAGRFDAFFEVGLQPWDIAAGALLTEEAGGLVTDLAGGHEHMKTGNIAGGPAKVMRELLPLLRPVSALSRD